MEIKRRCKVIMLADEDFSRFGHSSWNKLEKCIEDGYDIISSTPIGDGNVLYVLVKEIKYEGN